MRNLIIIGAAGLIYYVGKTQYEKWQYKKSEKQNKEKIERIASMSVKELLQEMKQQEKYPNSIKLQNKSKVKVFKVIKNIPGQQLNSAWRNPEDIVILTDGRIFLTDPREADFSQYINEYVDVYFNTSRGYNWIQLPLNYKGRRWLESVA